MYYPLSYVVKGIVGCHAPDIPSMKEEASRCKVHSPKSRERRALQQRGNPQTSFVAPDRTADAHKSVCPRTCANFRVGLPSPFRGAKYHCDSEFEGPCGPVLIVHMTRVAATLNPHSKGLWEVTVALSSHGAHQVRPYFRTVILILKMAYTYISYHRAGYPNINPCTCHPMCGTLYVSKPKMC